MTKDNAGQTIESDELASLTADIVSAYVANNTVTATDLPEVIANVSAALNGAAHKAQQPVGEDLTPAVPIKKSVTPDFIICLEDGKKFKSLKRHLRTHFDMSPDEYRQKWGLPHDYPMVAPNYSAERSKLAVNSGLGQKRKK